MNAESGETDRGYARKDRQTKSRDPTATRYVAQLFETVGTDCFVTLDVHNIAAFQNAFGCSIIDLNAQAFSSGRRSRG